MFTSYAAITTILEHFHYPRKKSLSISISPSTPPAPSNQWSNLSLWICLLQTFHTDGVIQYVVFHDWLLLLDVMFSRVIHVVVCISSSFRFMAELYSIVWNFNQLIFPPTAPVNNAAMNMHMQVFVWTCVFHFSWLHTYR